jgi:SAM-dependent MidA family methyltransferase
LPVHRVRAVGGEVAGRSGPAGQPELRELWVGVEAGELAWIERPAPAALERYLAEHGVTLRPGQLAELNLEAAGLHRQLLELAGDVGVSVVLDYGYEARRLYDSRGRLGGSLACYHEHRLERDPLLRPGRQDITAHVNWDDLDRAADATGWQRVGLWPLAEMLLRGGLADIIESLGLGMEAELDAATVTERQELKRLLDPEGMGSDLKALVQATPQALDAATAAWSSGPPGP